jgi:early secretory antigenic target protein ESAT-6
MSTPQTWDFGAIEGHSGEIHGAVGRTAGLLDEGKASLAALASVWGGSGSDAYQNVQTRWDSTANELNTALQQLAHTINEASSTMAQTEAGVTGLFT